MPQVFNGIGTWYWGKKNIRSRRGVCQQCGRAADMRSYDSTLFFVVFMIPLIPLKKVRVMEDCSLCHKHRVTGLRKWEKAKRETMGAQLAACRADPEDAGKIKEALSACVGFEDEATFAEIAAIASETMTENAEVQDMLGSAYGFFGHADLSEFSFRTSLNLKDDPEVAIRLGAHLLRTGRATEGWTLVKPLVTEQHPERMGVAYLAAMAFQAEGNHEAALEALDQAMRANPSLARDKTYLKMRRVSEKNRTTGKKVKGEMLGAGGGQLTERRMLSKAPSALAAVVVLAIVAGFFGGSWYKGNNRRVYVVSGLERPSTVTIGSKKVTLPANGVQKVYLPEGTHSVQVEVEGVSGPSSTVTFSTPFMGRLFLSRTYVINADRLALIEWERVVYTASAPAAGAAPSEFKWYANQALHEFSGIDYEFKAFPSQIKLKRRTSATKERVDVARSVGTVAAWSTVSTQFGDGAARMWLENAARLKTDDPMVYMLIAGTFPKEDAEAVLKPLLEMRPVLVEPHRTYQEMMEQSKPEHDVTGEYRKLLAANPEDPVLQYLLGRVTHDMDEAMKLYRSAVKGPTPPARAHGAIAYLLTATGRFEEALEAARVGLAQATHDDAALRELETDLLIALGKHDELAKLALYRMTAEEAEPPDAIDKSVVLTLMGKKEDAAEWIAEYARMLKQEDEPLSEVWKRCARALSAYATGDAAPLAHLRAPPAGSSEKPLESDDADAIGLYSCYLASAVAGGGLEGVATQVEEDEPGWEWHVTLSIAAAMKGDKEMSEKQHELAVKALAEGSWEHRQAGKWLGQTEAPPIKEVLELSMQTYEKRLVLTALGIRFAEIRKPVFELAEKLNFKPEFPRLMIAEAVRREWP